MSMLHRLRQRSQSEKGFTLIELLVVILIIGILAAIALPAFLGQRTKGQDSDAKSNARNAVSQMESCFQEQDQKYTGCTIAADSGLPISGTNAVSAVGTPKGYTITALSKSDNTFTITKADDGTTTRGCTDTTSGKGGCNESWGTVGAASTGGE